MTIESVLPRVDLRHCPYGLRITDLPIKISRPKNPTFDPNHVRLYYVVTPRGEHKYPHALTAEEIADRLGVMANTIYKAQRSEAKICHKYSIKFSGLFSDETGIQELLDFGQ